MNLPVLNTPTYEMEIPSTGEKIKYRPFLVKEQKLLMMAQESGDEAAQMRTVGEIVKNCTFNKIDKPDTMATFDIEYMFLMTRAQSVGSKIPMTVTCPDDGETKVEHEINIDEIKVKKTDGHTNVIMLTDDIGITMKYPNLDMVKKFTNTANITEVSFEMIKSCIQNIFDKDQVYDEMSDKDLQSFIEQMNTEQFERIQDFFMSVPRVKYKMNFVCKKCGHENERELVGIQDFFG